jgi:hypothetical protein
MQSARMSQSDLWEKAVACAKAAGATGDPKKRSLLIRLGEFWLDLARVNSFQIDDAMAINIAVMERVQAELIETSPVFH